MKKLLIVVDYQNDFINGALGFPGAENLAPVIASKIDAYHKDGEVAFTLDTHGEDYLSTSEGKHLPIPHCIRYSEGHELFPAIKALKLDSDRSFEKPTFGSAELFDFLRNSEYEQIELCGLVTDICVVSNALLAKAALPEAEVIVDSKAVDSFDKAKQEAALAVMESVQIKVLR